MSNDSRYSSYREAFNSLFNKGLTKEEAAQVVDNFDEKLEEVRGKGKASIAETAARIWEYFSSPTTTDNARVIAGLALLYFIVPYDLIPDMTVFFGYADDLALMALALRRLGAIGALAKTAKDNFREYHGL